VKRKASRIVPLLLPVLMFLIPAAHAASPGYKGYARGEALITVQELKQAIDADDPRLVILAAENDLEYYTGHIPGSLQVDRPAYAAPADTQGGVEGNLIDAAGFTRLAQRLGVDADSRVVIYEDRYEATRLWWAFVYYGKPDVRILDGGIQAWKDAGYDVDYLSPKTPSRLGSFVAAVARPRLRVDTREVGTLAGDAGAQLWDARSLAEFSGEEKKKGAFRAGRIPGSRHSEWVHFKTERNHAEWATASQLESLLQENGFDPGKDQYFYCQSGVRSTQPLFALYLAGWPLEKLHNYDGSWIGWSKDPALPLESGLPVPVARDHARR